jgi:hypothetical protein
MSGLEKNFAGMFYSDRVISCPYCSIKFATVPQLKTHKENYCTTEEHYELLDDMFDSTIKEIETGGNSSMVNEKNFVLLKGLYLLRNEWDRFLNYLEDPKAALLVDQ